jgi:hypothetical protein
MWEKTPDGENLMEKAMRLIYAGMALTFATLGFGDTITLKNGNVINGNYLGGTARTVRVEVGDNIQTVDVSDISRIEFGGMAAPAAPIQRQQSNVTRPPEPPPPAPQPVAQGSVTLPAGTNFVIRLIDGVDSENSRVGQSFAASLDQPVMVGGDTVIPRGADVTVKLVDSKESGKLTGRAELALSLQSIRVNGQMVDVNTQTVKEVSDSRTGKTAKVAGGTAALGAIIGAIAGGGKGAAIGAGAGAATGAGVQVVTAGQRVRIPSETRLTFVLDNPVRL